MLIYLIGIPKAYLLLIQRSKHLLHGRIEKNALISLQIRAFFCILVGQNRKIMRRRIVINTTDISQIFGISNSQAQRKLSEVRRILKKEGLPITVGEFCQVYKLPVMEVKQALKIA